MVRFLSNFSFFSTFAHISPLYVSNTITSFLSYIPDTFFIRIQSGVLDTNLDEPLRIPFGVFGDKIGAKLVERYNTDTFLVVAEQDTPLSGMIGLYRAGLFFQVNNAVQYYPYDLDYHISLNAEEIRTLGPLFAQWFENNHRTIVFRLFAGLVVLVVLISLLVSFFLSLAYMIGFLPLAILTWIILRLVGVWYASGYWHAYVFTALVSLPLFLITIFIQLPWVLVVLAFVILCVYMIVRATTIPAP